MMGKRRCPSAVAEGHLLHRFWLEEGRLILIVLFATRFLISKRDDELEKVLHAASPFDNHNPAICPYSKYTQYSSEVQPEESHRV